MAAKYLLLFLLILFTHPKIPNATAQVDNAGIQLMADALEWTVNPNFPQKESTHCEEQEDDDDDVLNPRSLYWRSRGASRRYYISYGALSANRIPCPARSGRSYYTHNCYRARGPVNPYRRGCSAITRCRM